MSRVKLVIDSDGVSDDVRAISIALQLADVKALTAVHGCVSVSQVVANLSRTLRANAIHNVPIYRGASGPLIPAIHSSESFFFGVDGIGDSPNAFPSVVPEDFTNFDAKCPAALALIELCKQHRDLTLVCLGPLTNVALAIKLDPQFASNGPRNIVLMGGNSHGCGNVKFDSTAEFNFHRDPEAAHCVFAEMQCPITCVPWEAYLFQGQQDGSQVDFHAHLSLGTPLADFFLTATRIGRDILAKNGRQFAFCDEIAVAVAIDAARVMTKSREMRASVELHGQFTRGQVAIDWLNDLWANEEPNQLERLDRRRRPITFLLAYDVHVVDEMIHEAVRKSLRE